jgi:hypothetical protein
VGTQNFRGKLRRLFHVLSDDAVASTVTINDNGDQDDAMDVELVASAFVESQQSGSGSGPSQQSGSGPSQPTGPQNIPSTPANNRAPPGTPGTKHKATDGGGNSSSRTRLQF